MTNGIRRFCFAGITFSGIFYLWCLWNEKRYVHVSPSATTTTMYQESPMLDSLATHFVYGHNGANLVTKDEQVCSTELQRQLSDVEKRLEKLESEQSQRMLELRVDELMMSKALARNNSFHRLKRSFREVLLNNRSLVIGLVGGSISVATALDGRQYLFANILTNTLQQVLGSPVELQNGALGGTTSFYHTLCMEAHLDLDKLDVMLWELAANDYYGFLDASPQEEFTRNVLSLSNEPQLIYANFQYGKHTLEKNCINNLQCCSDPLSKYYDIPSIAMPYAVCTAVKNGSADDLVAPDNAHPSRKAHAIMALFLTRLMKYPLMDTIKDLQSECDGHSTNVYNVTYILPKPLFKRTRITRPQCWSTTSSESGNKNDLVPLYRNGWTLHSDGWGRGRVDKKRYWLSETNTTITFDFQVKPYKNKTSDLLVVTMGCSECGMALLILDNNKRYQINTNYEFHTCRIHYIDSGIKAAYHILKVKSLTEPVRFVAIVTAYDDMHEQHPGKTPKFSSPLYEAETIRSK